MRLYETVDIGGKEVHLYQIKYITNKLGWTAMAVRQKEKRGMIPKANFRSPSGIRLYTVEEMAMFEYLFKEIWPFRQGVKTPDWVKALSKDVFRVIRAKVLTDGRLTSEDDFLPIQDKYSQYGFNKYRAWLYILSWRDIFESERHDILKELISEIEE